MDLDAIAEIELIVIAFIFVAVTTGGLSICLGWSMIVRDLFFRKTVAEVVEVVRDVEHEDVAEYHVVRFKDHRGRDVYHESPTRFYNTGLEPGDMIDVAFHPRDTERVELIHPQGNLTKLSFVFAIASVISLVIALIHLLSLYVP